MLKRDLDSYFRTFAHLLQNLWAQTLCDATAMATIPFRTHIRTFVVLKLATFSGS